jgi:hypothetical protein
MHLFSTVEHLLVDTTTEDPIEDTKPKSHECGVELDILKICQQDTS